MFFLIQHAALTIVNCLWHEYTTHVITAWIEI